MNSLFGNSNQYDHTFGLYLSKVQRMPIFGQDTLLIRLLQTYKENKVQGFQTALTKVLLVVLHRAPQVWPY